jgi:hypothetical protein
MAALKPEPRPNTVVTKDTTTTEQPKAVQAVVAPTAAPVPAPAKVKSDRYRIKGPGSVFRGNKMLRPGTVVTLSEVDALSVMDLLEPV